MPDGLHVRLLLDTSYCLHLIRRRPPGAQAAFERYRPGEIAVSALTVAVLRRMAAFSAAPEQNHAALDHFLLPLTVLDFNADAAGWLGRLPPGPPMAAAGAGDTSLLAAQALGAGAALVTARPEMYAHLGAGAELRVLAGLEGELAPATPAAMPAPPRRAAGLHTIHLAGSHDLSLDVLARALHDRRPGWSLDVNSVGSLPGLLALQRREAELAAVHLLDEATGEFNAPFIRHLLTPLGLHVVLLGFVQRRQGLIVARGNPKGICTLEDLARPDIAFINRQPGSGTRMLLDLHLRRASVAPAQVCGYERSEATHSAVAAAVARGEADCGLGIQAAAAAQGLDFAPLFDERFDLVVPTEQYEGELLAPLVALLRQPGRALRREVAALGGYDTAPMGKVLAVM
jgi:molybdate-binding protein/predicted nucleic acid-binding protein